jgi:arylsulfatase A-like enzyme
MTGLLPHNHGVIQNTHVVPEDQAVLREDKPHWAQRLVEVGYRTAYYGKWHVERSGDLGKFGWQDHAISGSARFRDRTAKLAAGRAKHKPVLSGWVRGPEGYEDRLLYAATAPAPFHATLETASDFAGEFLAGAIGNAQPWCCFVSAVEPHDPFVVSKAAFDQYPLDAIPVPPNWNDDLAGRPGLYRKVRHGMEFSERQKREAAACYYALISGIDRRYGELLRQVEQAGELDNTIVVFTADHGEFLGAHGLYVKNVGAFEEAYNIPLVVAGPGVARGALASARAGLHDLGPTLLELAGARAIGAPDSRSLAPVLRHPAGQSGNYQTGCAEYYGSVAWYSQRVIWDGAWKFVWNGFDYDELYNLENDPYELKNLAADPAYRERLRHMTGIAWRIAGETGEERFFTHYSYPTLRFAPFGPGRKR